MRTHSDFPFSLAGFDHVAFRVDDLRKGMGFYIGVLGCEKGYAYPSGGMEPLWRLSGRHGGGGRSA
ncbi:hypothetical protein K32_34800 [Kaistia sp. 32K]|nr:hypothetical protein K32_34800 [Kaistia sp. 32K]